MAAGTLLPLFWDLASADRKPRLNSTHKLVSTLQQFQEKFLSEAQSRLEPDADSEDEDESQDKKDEGYQASSRKLDRENAADVSYSVRRLIRGLASPRESSRLGFAVALTELLSRIDTVSCLQILTLLKKESQTTGSMSGQEERDMLFARLFGLKAIIQSGLLTRKSPLRMSSTSASSLDAFLAVLSELVTLSKKKSWLRESCWWALTTMIDMVDASDVAWKQDAFTLLFTKLYIDDTTWGPEKIAVTVQLQKMHPDVEWSKYCGEYLKNPNVLSPANFPILARLLKDSVSEESMETEHKIHGAGPWKPQLHFVWNVILDGLLGSEKKRNRFQEFYRVAVDETLFAAASSPQRKYWGLQVFQGALRRLPSSELSMLFTKNFMRTWINHLSKSDRYLHKLAQHVANDLQQVVEKDPKTGFSLVLQLTGTNGSFHFDRVTKTKTIETILSNMDEDGIKEYVEYLLRHFNEEKEEESSSLDSQRIWIIEQMSALLRKGSIPRNIKTTELILNWLTTNALFKVEKSSKKSANAALHIAPNPPLSKELQDLCTSKLLACLADLLVLPSPREKSDDVEASKISGTGIDGDFWIGKVLGFIAELEKDTKHVSYRREPDSEGRVARKETLKAIGDLKISTKSDEAAAGSTLLLSALLLKAICDEEADWEVVTECGQAANDLLRKPELEKKKKNKKQKMDEENEESAPPIDILVDIIIGLLEGSTSFTRTIANQSFAMLTPLMTDSTVGLILAQLERRDPSKEEEELDELSADSDDADSSEDSQSKSKEDDEEDKQGSEAEEDVENLRKALGDVVAANGKENDDESDVSSESEESMDDEQMMAIDEKLAAAFRTRQEERKKGKDIGAQREATYFKNRVLDLADLYLKRQPSSGLVLRFMLPLIQLVTMASNDEKQLSDKAKGILRSRYSKPKELSTANVAEANALLESLHKMARKSHYAETVSIIGMCSLFVTKILVACGDQETPTRVYEESIKDFITRKSSGLNTAFITDFVRRYPRLAWGIRVPVVEAISEAANGYRQTQAFSIVQSLATQVLQQDVEKAEMISFMQLVSDAFITSVSKSCSEDKPLMTTAQMKDTLKCASQLCRFSKRIADEDSPSTKIWQPERWSGLAVKLSESDSFKASVSLSKTCQQISQLAAQGSVIKATKKGRQLSGTSKGQTKSSSASKRKVEEDAEDGADSEPKPKKPKRKKVRKVPTDGL